MTPIDALVMTLYGLAALALGLRFRASANSSQEWLLAGRSLPTWAVLLSMVATELSAATFLGVPHAAFTGDWSYLQLALGSLTAKTLLALWVIPRYHALGLVTVYGFLEQRFGGQTRRGAAGCFAVGRVLASGVRLFIASLALSVLTDWSVEASIVVSGVVAGLYTGVGGIRAVVWTDVLQAIVLLTGALGMTGFLLMEIGGIEALMDWARPEQRTRVWHVTPFFALSDTKPLGVAFIAGGMLTLATHSTDHDMVQRLLCTKDGASGGRALWGSALLNVPLSALFLLLGTALAAFYGSHPELAPAETSRIVPHFAMNSLPAGLRGLVFAGVLAAAMSSLDSAICALASVWSVDLAPARWRSTDNARASRRASIVACALLIAAGLGMAGYERAMSSQPAAGLSLVDLALSAMTILYGGLLGVFGAGFLSREPLRDGAGIAGLAVGTVSGILLFLHPVLLGETSIAWGWWIPISALLSGSVARLAGRRPARGRS